MPVEAPYRIGAVASMTGIPVTTLRIWELRHHAFSPVKTAGRHRLYSPQDVEKATLLKQLGKQGHLISSIAGLDLAALRRLGQPPEPAPAQPRAGHGTLAVAVVGSGLARRLGSAPFGQHLPGMPLKVTDVFADLAQAVAASLREQPQVLLVRVNSLHDGICADIQALARRHAVPRTVVIYSFAREIAVQTLRAGGILVRREPVSDSELSGLIAPMLLADPAWAPDGQPADGLIPARRYSDETLSRVAGMSTSVLCECPRHIAELTAQLASFEQYNQECLNKTREDAQLHAYLQAVSGSARALFERALEMVARHENIALPAIGSPEP